MVKNDKIDCKFKNPYEFNIIQHNEHNLFWICSVASLQLGGERGDFFIKNLYRYCFLLIKQNIKTPFGAFP